VLLIGDNGTPSQVPPTGYTANKVKQSTYEGGVRVPFIVAGLGFQESYVSDQPVSVVDVIPTLMDLAGVCQALPTWDGQSILPALDGDPLARAWVYVQKGETGERAVIEALWKLREEADLDQWLYDLSADPFENTPIDPDAPGYEDVTLRLRSELAEAQS
jgi:arylsulfatase A-like enzyme